MAARRVPADVEMEESLLGAAMLSREAVEVAVARLVASDFYKPQHGRIFSAIAELYRNGQPVDPKTVGAELDEQEPDGLSKIGGQFQLVRIQAATPASANAQQYIEVIVDRAARRSVIASLSMTMDEAYDLTVETDQLIDRGKAQLADAQRSAQTRTHPHYAEWSQGVDMTENWQVPGILERRDRILLVAPEGIGKSFLLRQWALMCAAGVHWFTERPMPPSNVLVLDVENSGRQLVRNTQVMHRFARAQAGDRFKEENFTIIPFDVMDLASRASRLNVESYLAGHRPDLIVIGPLYKILPPPGRDLGYEEQALQGIHVIDSWRARFDLSVLIEHHAAKGSGGKRSMDPLNSSAFMRWPEFGLTLEPQEDNPRVVKLGRFRGDRESRPWPANLERGGYGQWQWRAPDSHQASGEEPF